MDWTPYEVAVECAHSVGLDPPFVVVTSEDEYVRHFCSRSKIDWQRFRLAVYAESGFDRLFVDEVTQQGSDLVVVVQRLRTCGAVPAMFQVNYVAALIPAGSGQVQRVHADLNMPCTKWRP